MPDFHREAPYGQESHQCSKHKWAGVGTCPKCNAYKFKVGDRIRRKPDYTYDGSWNHVCCSLGLDERGTFVVANVDPASGFIRLKEMTRWFKGNLFELSKDGDVAKDVTDMVSKPSHYDFFPGVEAIVIIARSMTEKQFEGYCMGNALKYRLRAGKKWNTEEDLKKADEYGKLFDKYRHCCMQEDI